MNWIQRLNQSGNPNVPFFGRWGLLQIVLALGAIGVAVAKLAFGLGVTTNLSDNWPWGLWVAFDVGAYIASAAGGFMIAMIVYVFKSERYRPLVRPAILTAALCYTIGGTGILIDLGRSINIVHPIWMWQHESIMFEVAWCVMAYLTVLYLEFSPNIFERFRQKTALRVQHFILMPLVFFGIMLSFLHQSSLGALFLITPQQQPLWHGPLMGYLFLISAVALGLSVVSLFSVVLSKSWKMPIRLDVLSRVGLIIAWTLAVYLVARFGEFIYTGNLSAFKLDTFGGLFILEVGFGMLAPMLLLFIKRVRSSAGGLISATSLVIMGVVLNRLNVLVISQAPDRVGSYFPAWSEFLFTLGLIAGAMYVFRLAAKYLPLYSDHLKGIPQSTLSESPEVVPAT